MQILFPSQIHWKPLQVECCDDVTNWTVLSHWWKTSALFNRSVLVTINFVKKLEVVLVFVKLTVNNFDWWIIKPLLIHYKKTHLHKKCRYFKYKNLTIKTYKIFWMYTIDLQVCNSFMMYLYFPFNNNTWHTSTHFNTVVNKSHGFPIANLISIQILYLHLTVCLVLQVVKKVSTKAESVQFLNIQHRIINLLYSSRN